MHIAFGMHLRVSPTGILWKSTRLLGRASARSHALFCEMCVRMCPGQLDGASQQGIFLLKMSGWPFGSAWSPKARGAGEGLSSKLMPAVIACTLLQTAHAAVLTYDNVFALKSLRGDHFYPDLGFKIKLWCEICLFYQTDHWAIVL